MKPNKILYAIIFVFSFTGTFAQSKTIQTPPGNIQLLPGYVHERRSGVDSEVGEIKKPGGLLIKYDIGRMAGNYVKSNYEPEKLNSLWLKSQKIKDQELTILYLKNGNIYATFTSKPANFFSNVKTNEELAEFLIIIFTYDSESAKKPAKTAKPN